MTPSPACDSILVGVDGSEASARAVLWAEEQARLQRVPLVLVHAIDPRRSLLAGASGFGVTQFMDEIEAGARELLETTRAAIRRDPGDDLEIGTVFERADARKVLMDLSGDAAMIVVGSRGRGPVRSLLLGSVSVALTQHARCPVVVMRPQDDDSGQRHIVVGLAGGRPLSGAVEFAFSQASLRSLSLIIVHGLWEPLVGYVGATELASSDPALGDEAALAERTVAGMREKFPDVAVSYRAAKGLPDESLLAVSTGSDMIVVGSQHHSSGRSLLEGSVSRAVAEHARCAVAVIPER